MRVSVINDVGAFAKLKPEWDKLSANIPFRSWEWAYSWWRAFHTSKRSLLILRVDDVEEYNVEEAGAEGNVVGLLPLFTDHTMKYGRTLQWLGSKKACGDYLDLLVEPAFAADVGTELARWMTSKDCPYAWDTISLDGVSAENSHVDSLARMLGERSCRVSRRPIESAWILEVPPTWEDYLATLSKRTRRTLRGLERDYRGRTQYETLTGREAVETGLPLLIDMHQKRREALGSMGCYSFAGFDQFITGTFEHFDQTMGLSLNLLSLDGEPAAANLGFMGKDVFYIYQVGFYPEFQAHKPGWLLNIAAVKHGQQGRYQRIDFLRGDERYKSSLGARPKPLKRIEIVAPNSAAQIRHSVRIAGSTLKGWVTD